MLQKFHHLEGLLLQLFCLLQTYLKKDHHRFSSQVSLPCLILLLHNPLQRIISQAFTITFPTSLTANPFNPTIPYICKPLQSSNCTFVKHSPFTHSNFHRRSSSSSCSNSLHMLKQICDYRLLPFKHLVEWHLFQEFRSLRFSPVLLSRWRLAATP